MQICSWDLNVKYHKCMGKGLTHYIWSTAEKHILEQHNYLAKQFDLKRINQFKTI